GISNSLGTYLDGVSVTANALPTANAGPNQNGTVLHDGNPATNTLAFTLDGSGSSDPDAGDSITSYTWTEGGSPLATGVSPTVSLTPGSHTIYLTVEDT